MEKPILVYSDFNKMFKLYTNALDVRLGVVSSGNVGYAKVQTLLRRRLAI